MNENTSNMNQMEKEIRNNSVSELNMLFNEKLTENGDASYKSTGNKLVDLLFKADYYSKHLTNAKIGTSKVEKLFSMFVRDPRHGLKYRDLGRSLMIQSGVTAKQVVAAGRFDDLWKTSFNGKTNPEWISYIISECKNGNELAKKWMPHYVGKMDNGSVANSTIAASVMRKAYNAMYPGAKINKQQYNKFVKVSTVESKLSQHNNDAIDFSKLPSLAIMKYWARFKGTSKNNPKTDMRERFLAYIESVKKGEAKMNMSVASVYDIYCNCKNIDADLVYSKMEQCHGSWLPILDTSGSMFDLSDSIGKACAIAHYLAKGSTYCPNQVMSFSDYPSLITLGNNDNADEKIYRIKSSMKFRHGRPCSDHMANILESSSQYASEIVSMYTGDCANSTNFGATMKILSGLKRDFPEYLVILSDMEFNQYAHVDKDALMKDWRSKGIKTKMVWWNFNSRNETCPETDEYGNMFMSGYNPSLLKFLDASFDAEKFLAKLLSEYKGTLPKDVVAEF